MLKGKDAWEQQELKTGKDYFDHNTKDEVDSVKEEQLHEKSFIFCHY